MAQAKKGTAVAVRSSEISERQQEAQARLQQAITEMARPEQTPEEMILAILDAKSVDDLFGRTAVSLKDIPGKPFTIERAWLNESDYTEGLPAFAVMEVEYNDGTKGVVTTGATACVAAVITAHANGWFPLYAQAQEEETSSGFTVRKFVKPSEPKPTQEQLKPF